MFARFEHMTFTHFYSFHVTGRNGGHKTLSSCLGWRRKKKKKKLNLIVLDSGVEVVYDYLSDGTSVQER